MPTDDNAGDGAPAIHRIAATGRRSLTGSCALSSHGRLEAAGLPLAVASPFRVDIVTVVTGTGFCLPGPEAARTGLLVGIGDRFFRVVGNDHGSGLLRAAQGMRPVTAPVARPVIGNLALSHRNSHRPSDAAAHFARHRTTV